MLLEKLKQHGGKIMFFAMNILVVVAGILIIKQRDTEKNNAVVAEFDAQNYKSAVDYAYDAQQRILADQNAKISSISNNTGTINKEQVVSVTRTIPAVTKTETVKQPAKTTTTTKATTKKS